MIRIPEETLARLRAYAHTPDREPMGRALPWPRLGDRVLATKRDLEATRAALREALAIIDLLNGDD